jgi:hypothetical protein
VNTPGPWEVVKRPAETGGKEKLHIDAKGGNFAVARVFESESPVGQANADLISAAPDLLQVAKMVLLELGKFRESEWASVLLAMARTAVNKARRME